MSRPQRCIVDPVTGTRVRCPECGEARQLPAEECERHDTLLSVLCPCGATFQCSFEYRRYCRWRTRFPGKFTVRGRDLAGPMIVRNVSEGGIGFSTESDLPLRPGDVLDVEFEIQDQDTRRRSQVVHADDGTVGVRFDSPLLVQDENDPGDPESASVVSRALADMREALHDLSTPDQRTATPDDPPYVARLYAADAEQIRIDCPTCGHTRSMDVKRLKKLGGRIMVDCRCGERFQCELEHRRYPRKPVNLLGEYRGPDSRKPADMFVEDISLGGARLRLGEAHGLTEGDVLEIRFRPPPEAEHHVKRQVQLRFVEGSRAGARFLDEEGRPTLGFLFLA